MEMENLFGAEFAEPNNCCAAPTNKKSKQKKPTATIATTAAKMSEDTPLEVHQMQVKVYNDFFLYEAPEELEIPKVGDVRKWLVAQGFSELTAERAQFVWIKPDDEADRYLYAGVKFEKQG